MKNYWADFHETGWRGVAWAKEEPIMFWSGSRNSLTRSLTLRDKEFGLGGDLRSLSALLVLTGLNLLHV